MASTGFKQGGAVLKEFKAKRRQLWQYLNTSVDYFLRAVGLRTTSELEAGVLFDNPCGITKCENELLTIGGEVYETYRLQGIQQTFTSAETSPGSGIWEVIEDFGTVIISEGPMLITQDSSVVVADNTAAPGGGFEHTPIANSGSLVDDLTGGGTNNPSFFYLTQTQFGPVENQAIAVNGLATFQMGGELYIDFKFIVQQGAEVSIERI